MKQNYKKLGNSIKPVDVRNTDLKVSHLLGVSVEKKFIESIANTIGTDFLKIQNCEKRAVCLWSCNFAERRKNYNRTS